MYDSSDVAGQLSCCKRCCEHSAHLLNVAANLAAVLSPCSGVVSATSPAELAVITCILEFANDNIHCLPLPFNVLGCRSRYP